MPGAPPLVLVTVAAALLGGCDRLLPFGQAHDAAVVVDSHADRRGPPDGPAAACETLVSCDDGLDCTQDSPASCSGKCAHTMKPGSCLIGGVCYGPGPNAAGSNRVCDPTLWPDRWVPARGCVITFAGDGTQGFTAKGSLASTRLTYPLDVAVDAAGAVFVSDGELVRAVQVIKGGSIATLAGGPSSNPPAFAHPTGLTVDAAGVRVLVADQNLPAPQLSCVREILNGVLTPLPLVNDTGNPSDVVIGATGVIYVAVRDSDSIKTIGPTGKVSTLSGGTSGCQDGALGVARFNKPTGVAVGPDGAIYVSDGDNHRIRKIDLSRVGNEVSTVAGPTCASGAVAPDFKDGPWSEARFNLPQSVAVDADRVYIADGLNHCIRSLRLAAGTVETVGGSCGSQGLEDGPSAAARFNQPTGVALDSKGLLYVADYYNHAVRMLRLP